MMQSFLLDTNVISETSRPNPNQGVLDFLSASNQFFVSVISLHEMRHGAELVRSAQQREALLKWLAGMRKRFDQEILPITSQIAELAAEFRATAQKQGRVLHIEDALIAATASAHHCTLATRNVADFEVTKVSLLDPWDGGVNLES